MIELNIELIYRLALSKTMPKHDTNKMIRINKLSSVVTPQYANTNMELTTKYNRLDNFDL